MVPALLLCDDENENLESGKADGELPVAIAMYSLLSMAKRPCPSRLMVNPTKANWRCRLRYRFHKMVCRADDN
jgi:hypothetical protein